MIQKPVCCDYYGCDSTRMIEEGCSRIIELDGVQYVYCSDTCAELDGHELATPADVLELMEGLENYEEDEEDT